MLNLVSKKAVEQVGQGPRSMDDSWTIKHEPKFLSDVPVHNSKTKATRDWLSQFADGDSGVVHILALCGNSGCCKSVAVELICKEMNIEVVNWNESLWDGSIAGSSVGNSGTALSSGQWKHEMRGGQYGSSKNSRKSEKLEDFAMHTKYPSLNLAYTVDGKAGDRKEAKNPVSASRKILLIHDPPDVTNVSSGSSRNNTNWGGSSSTESEALYAFILQMSCPVVMIVSDVSGRDEYLHAADRCLPQSIRERVHFEALYFPPVTELKIVKILQKIAKAERLSAVTTPHLEAIAGCCGGDVRQALAQLQLVARCPSLLAVVPPALSDVVDLTQGSSDDDDNQREQEGPAVKRRKTAPSIRGPSSLAESFGRDLSFSGMHSAAKLLNAKLDGAGHLDFNPDLVVDSSELSSDVMIAFLQGNCIEHSAEKCRCLPTSDTTGGARMQDESFAKWWSEPVDMICIDQIERALQRYSDVDILASKKYEAGNHIDRESGVFPDQYVAALQARVAAVSRGVGFQDVYEAARASKTFTPAFLPLRRPRVFGMRAETTAMRRRLNEARESMLGLSVPGQDLHVHSIGLASDLILCTVPFYKAIKSAQRERSSYPTPIFSEIIDWKLDTLNQSSSNLPQRPGTNGKTISQRIGSLETDFSSVMLEDDIEDDE